MHPPAAPLSPRASLVPTVSANAATRDTTSPSVVQLTIDDEEDFLPPPAVKAATVQQQKQPAPRRQRQQQAFVADEHDQDLLLAIALSASLNGDHTYAAGGAGPSSGGVSLLPVSTAGQRTTAAGSRKRQRQGTTLQPVETAKAIAQERASVLLWPERDASSDSGSSARSVNSTSTINYRFPVSSLSTSQRAVIESSSSSSQDREVASLWKASALPATPPLGSLFGTPPVMMSSPKVPPSAPPLATSSRSLSSSATSAASSSAASSSNGSASARSEIVSSNAMFNLFDVFNEPLPSHWQTAAETDTRVRDELNQVKSNVYVKKRHVEAQLQRIWRETSQWVETTIQERNRDVEELLREKAAVLAKANAENVAPVDDSDVVIIAEKRSSSESQTGDGSYSQVDGAVKDKGTTRNIPVVDIDSSPSQSRHTPIASPKPVIVEVIDDTDTMLVDDAAHADDWPELLPVRPVESPCLPYYAGSDSILHWSHQVPAAPADSDLALFAAPSVSTTQFEIVIPSSPALHTSTSAANIVAAAASTQPPDANIDVMTVVQLKAYAKQHSIKLLSKWKRAEIVDAVKGHIAGGSSSVQPTAAVPTEDAAPAPRKKPRTKPPAKDGASTLTELHDEIETFLKGHAAYYPMLLRYQPLPFTDLLADLQDAGVACVKKQLSDYLDYQGINFVAPAVEGRWNRKPRTKKKRSRPKQQQQQQQQQQQPAPEVV